ncbi:MULTISPECIES: RagB/SusD family nutrient uptake outer membrane protein [Proteiniphilum]|uniref:RagB/SusD family nutrient uptake outer membrane protein n=1 Tax=Proteiniphilum TaxID=294702 RepID=UPI0028AB0944|nr:MULTISPECIES: RagB/SusD family nutrient uptake outer membrane protein [Proteiniphilum]MDY9919694.1 RagB/SusD family nutrient uptake outer membrane protein [Proteiniphilum sp.]
MKKIIYILFAVFLLNACDVSVENPNSIMRENFWKTETDAQYGINAVYNMFYKPGTYSRWIWFRFDLTSDEGFSQSPWAELKEWTDFRYNNYNFWEGNGWTYRDCYEAIFRANQVLHFVPDIPFANENDRARILGQAYFLRGLYYYNLALLWGGENNSLAIVLEPSTPGMQPEGHTGTEVYQQAISDFTEAEKMLPEEWDGANKGRATKGAALAFRAKCYMQLYQWDEARSDLQWLVEGAGKSYYDLTANYADNFRSNTENNIESVFEIQYSDVNKAPAGDGDFDVDPNLGLNRGQFFAPPGIGWTDGEIRPWLVTEFKKEKNLNDDYDIRLRHTAFYSEQHLDFPDNERIYGEVSNEDTWNRDNWKGRVFYRKYSSEHFRDFDDYHNPTNVRLVRFADVLLMYAECIVQSGGNLADAVAHVDRVRARVNMPALAVNHAAATSDKDAFLKRLQMERALELATEGHRWADIKRWGLLDNQTGIDELKSRDPDFNNFVIGRHSRLPIPSDEVNNNPNISQNPNY